VVISKAKSSVGFILGRGANGKSLLALLRVPYDI